jgi:glycosyltransferase involved in cell wall biosynthesis
MLRVTTIIPSYNRANYLPLAVDSVLGQTYPVAEIIVVDDGSTDNTREVLKSYEGKVRFYQQNHGGVSAARNKGLELAQGEVIAWCDADDLWDLDFLITTVPQLESDNTLDGVYAGVAHIDSAGNLLPQENRMAVAPDKLYEALAEDCFIQTTAFVARKRCFDQAGSFDLQFHICEDYDMWLRLARSCTIIGVSQPLVYYRIHNQNTVSNTHKWCQSRLAIADKHFGGLGVDSRALTSSQRRAHAFAYRAAAFKCVQDGLTDEGWQYLQRGVTLWPELLAQLNTFYELVCGDQPQGQRGTIKQLDVQGNSADVLRRLDKLFEQSDSMLAALQARAYGNAYLAAGMLSDQAGQWTAAIHYLFKALHANPRLGLDYLFMRRLLKVTAGPRLTNIWHNARIP